MCVASLPVVTVVVPAHNAEGTIRETLTSVLRQTYRSIEVIVVDDGSTDKTADEVLQVAADDSRVRLLRQENKGVAAARNAGIEAALGEFIAPIDADDLWHPTKIEKQLAVFKERGDRIGFVYCGCRHIDGDSKVIYTPPLPDSEGRVFLQHLFSNFVRNGSAMMARRSHFLLLGGYSSRLRELGAQGCEDFLLQAYFSAVSDGAAVPEYLVGYRQGPGRMSSDMEQMERSQAIALREINANLGGSPLLARWTRAADEFQSGVNSLKRAEYVRAAQSFSRAVASDFLASTFWAGQGAVGKIRKFGFLRPKPVGETQGMSFHEANPRSGVNQSNWIYRSRMDRLAKLDQTFQPAQPMRLERRQWETAFRPLDKT